MFFWRKIAIGCRKYYQVIPLESKTKILVIDDESTICRALELSLQREGYEVKLAFTAKSGLEGLKSFLPDVVILDLKLPDMDGISVLEKIKNFDEDIIVIMITAFGETKTAVEAIKKGSYDFITKPFDLNQLTLSIGRSLKERSLKRENEVLKSTRKTTKFITKDSETLKILSQIESVAKSDSAVLIEGETGTGKDIIASIIHEKSNRREKPLVSINCGAVPESLFESEIFGYEKNSFTGANSKKRGLLELANEGSFFFDEIGEMPQQLQVKLLRFLEDKNIRRIGGLRNISLDVRIIAATNKNLAEEVQNNNFRSDLYYRLNVISIKIPPLRKRVSDIPLLVNYFIDMFNKHFRKNIKGTSDEALKLLKAYQWPGNVRELRNVIERAFILTKDDIITEAVLPPEICHYKLDLQTLDEKLGFFPTLEELEINHIKKALYKTKWNITKASELLGISRFALQRRMKKYFDENEAK